MVENKKESYKESYYVITYRDPKDNRVVTLEAETIKDSNLGLSFISISDFVFETSPILINPSNQKLKERFQHTKTLHLSIYSIVSIEEVGIENRGLRFLQDKSNLFVLNKDFHL